ncbi:MAG: SusE domain-containing protein, partial [Tannerella sp.]|nr:SusE domain-containing protein [Tannerella sp.]
MKIIYQAGILAATCLLLFACDKSETEGAKGEPLTIMGPNEKVILLEANETATAVTFTWNKGVDRNPTDTVTYIFRMDIADRNFETATPRDTVTDFTRIYTVGELNEIIASQWKVHPGEEVNLEARVVANIRGEKFVYPEIAVTKFTVITYAYASVPLYLTGSANPDTNPATLTETVNGRLYKWQGNLNQGGFKFVYSPDSDLPSINKGEDNNTLVERISANQPDDLFPTEREGYYVINVDRKNMKINYNYVQYYFEKLYPVGNATSIGWSLGNLTALWDDGNPGIYIVYEGPLTEGELKIHTDTGWGGCFRPMTSNGSITSTDVQYTYSESEKGDLKWYVTSEE